jgi:signal transduction histidine kinase
MRLLPSEFAPAPRNGWHAGIDSTAVSPNSAKMRPVSGEGRRAAPLSGLASGGQASTDRPRMRIRHRIFLVGGIPIAIAALIGMISLLLEAEAERARSGALLAGAVYRSLLIASDARDDYLQAQPTGRSRHGETFAEAVGQAQADLNALAVVLRDGRHAFAVEAALEALAGYRQQMATLSAIAVQNDRVIAEMSSRVSELIGLTDEARDRQHRSNADIVASLAERDGQLRAARDIVQHANEVRAAAAAHRLSMTAPTGEGTSLQERELALVRLNNAVTDLAASLAAGGHAATADELERLTAQASWALPQPAARTPATEADTADAGETLALGRWAERLLKIHTTEQRALHDEVAELLTYSVQAHETEQATQNVAIATLKLGGRTDEALAGRDMAAINAILEESRQVADVVAALPISPLIQTEMIDALRDWRNRLVTTRDGLRLQNALLTEMDANTAAIVEGARSLNDALIADAEGIGATIQNVRLVGGVFGLLLAAATAFLVARSITTPLHRLQQDMMRLATDTEAGPIADARRRDELGDMARATNTFVTEIRRREQAWRAAKDRADTALADLRKAQAELIQAEKLASLGQLVAGVAHEINTPLGVALTTGTLLRDEAGRFAEEAASGQLRRSVLERFAERTQEGTRLLFANLSRAAELVHSFKQVAVDQASGERRRFEMDAWLDELLTSLGPVLRKAGHAVSIECPAGLAVNTYPGALAQVLTNLLLNSVAHAYGEGQTGRISIAVSLREQGMVRIVFADDGRGIPPENIGRVFDPFFTTGRKAGRTGLGLHIVYNLVTSTLNGRIELDSRPGEGTRFTIDIPADIAVDAAAERAVITGELA